MFRVGKIIDGNTIEVTQNWNFGDTTGKQVIVAGYKVELDGKKFSELGDEFTNNLAKERLTLLLNDKLVDLRVRPTESGSCIKDGKLNCRVFLDDVDISNYFVEFKK